jgi:hypothetical protein
MTPSTNGQGCKAVLVEEKNIEGRSPTATNLSGNCKLQILSHLKQFVSAITAEVSSLFTSSIEAVLRGKGSQQITIYCVLSCHFPQDYAGA